MTDLRVLIVDDELELRKSVRSVLKSTLPNLNIDFLEASDGEEALTMFAEGPCDLVLMDVRMPKLSGLETLSLIKEKSPQVFIVLMTAHSNLQDAIEAIKKGAYDYIEKPLQPEKLSQIVTKALEARELISNLAISSPVFDDDIESKFVGHSQKMKDIFTLINRLCKVDTTVLIRGENGTGKELVAKAIHFNSPRKNGEFIAINCGAIPENLIESELFGHEKGAFTGAVQRKIGKFQQANNGTIFLDEIAELRLDMQVKLLRILQEKRFIPVGSNREVKTNARILAATNQNLEKMIVENRFREDLFFRLNVMPIFLPPLRDRKDDIPELVTHFMSLFSKRHKRDLHSLTPKAMNALQTYDWPGNIRELENVIEHAFIVETGHEIDLSSLPMPVQEAKQTVDITFENYSGPLDYDSFKEKVEREFIINALKANHGKINRTVAHANIPKNTLLRKIKKYEIDVKEYY